MDTLLAAHALSVTFDTPEGRVRAVNGIDFKVAPGETLGIVGESGSGKTQAALALMGLLADNGRATGSVTYRGRELLGLPAAELNTVRGSKLTMVFQDPMASLNPYLRIRTQMCEVLAHHRGMRGADARRRAVELLDAVRIPDAASRIDLYPHEFSGGMRQRVMLAMALLCDPDLLVADEPTTALDVTVQAQILDLLQDLKRDFATAVVLITHDLGIVAGQCDRVLVMYAGRIVEQGPVDDVFHRPQHPYTEGLLQAVPRLDRAGDTRLATIPGSPPDALSQPSGCAYEPRCPYRFARCAVERPVLRPAGDARARACHLEGLGDG